MDDDWCVALPGSQRWNARSLYFDTTLKVVKGIWEILTCTCALPSTLDQVTSLNSKWVPTWNLWRQELGAGLSPCSTWGLCLDEGSLFLFFLGHILIPEASLPPVCHSVPPHHHSRPPVLKKTHHNIMPHFSLGYWTSTKINQFCCKPSEWVTPQRQRQTIKTLQLWCLK